MSGGAGEEKILGEITGRPAVSPPDAAGVIVTLSPRSRQVAKFGQIRRALERARRDLIAHRHCTARRFRAVYKMDDEAQARREVLRHHDEAIAEVDEALEAIVGELEALLA